MNGAPPSPDRRTQLDALCRKLEEIVEQIEGNAHGALRRQWLDAFLGLREGSRALLESDFAQDDLSNLSADVMRLFSREGPMERLGYSSPPGLTDKLKLDELWQLALALRVVGEIPNVSSAVEMQRRSPPAYSEWPAPTGAGWAQWLRQMLGWRRVPPGPR